MSGSRQALGKRAGLLLVARGVNLGAGVLTTLLLVRLMTSETFGQYAFAMSLVALGSVLVQFGLKQLVLREVSRAAARSDDATAARVIVWAASAVAVLSLVLALVAIPLLWAIGWTPERAAALWPTLLLLPVLGLTTIRVAALRGVDRVMRSQLPETVLRPLFLLTSLGLLWLAEARIEIAAQGLWLHLGAATFALMVALGLSPGKPQVRRGSAAPPHKAWAVALLPLGLAGGLELISVNIDILVLGLFMPFEDVGHYRAAVLIAAQAGIVMHVVHLMLSSRIAGMVEAERLDLLQKLLLKTTFWAGASVVAIVGALTLFGAELLTVLFREEFASALGPMLVLALAQLTIAVTGPVAMVLTMARLETDVLYGLAAGVALNLALNFALVPSFGMMGAASATFVSTIVWNVLLSLAVRRRMGISASILVPHRREAGVA